MFHPDDLRTVLDSGNINACSDQYLFMLLETFADTVNGGIQSELISDLMDRYLILSRQVEEKNRQLIRSDEIRQEAQRIAMMGNWEYDVATGVLNWSETMYDVLELDPASKPSVDIWCAMVHPDDRETVEKIIRKIRSGIAPEDLCYRLLMPDGRTKWIQIWRKPRLDSQGRIIAFVGTVQDITANKNNEEKLQTYTNDLEKLVEQKVQEIVSSRMETIYALVKLAESRDDDTGNHIERTSVYCKYLAGKLREHGLYPETVTEEFIETISLASPLHDIGKVGIPDAILLKPGRLTPEEFEVMKTHVLIGYNTLAGLQKHYPANKFFSFGMDIARYHHERWDGGGYMDGLRGEQIPLSARIMALADVYDALRSRRVYKEPYPHDKTVEIIRRGRATHFDPVLVDLFLENHGYFREIYDRLA